MYKAESLEWHLKVDFKHSQELRDLEIGELEELWEETNLHFFLLTS